MAVEARHLNFFQTAIDANINPYNSGYGLPPLSGTTTESFVPMYNNHSAVVDGVLDFPENAAVKADSSLTCAHNLPDSRKRAREAINPMMTCQIQNGNHCDSFTFMDEDVSIQIQQQQLEMDRFISQHNDEMRRGIEERIKRYSRRIIAAAVEQGIMKRLKAKDDEIEKMGKLNWALQEKVKSLSIEGQIWRDLAHTNEAAAHALRANLEQVLAAQLEDNEQHSRFSCCDGADVAALADDARSCCGSNYREEDGEECGTRGRERKCRQCGEGESSVLLLPCRHMCLCMVCESSVHTCPVCKAPKNASVHVIISDPQNCLSDPYPLWVD